MPIKVLFSAFVSLVFFTDFYLVLLWYVSV